ncbi:hypothetical protein SLA2020_402400 [Shorea laevis]
MQQRLWSFGSGGQRWARRCTAHRRPKKLSVHELASHEAVGRRGWWFVRCVGSSVDGGGGCRSWVCRWWWGAFVGSPAGGGRPLLDLRLVVVRTGRPASSFVGGGRRL